MALSDILRLTGGIWGILGAENEHKHYLPISILRRWDKAGLSLSLSQNCFVRVYCYYYPSRTSARSHKVPSSAARFLHLTLPTTNGLPTRTISETNSLKAGKTIQFVLRTRARVLSGTCTCIWKTSFSFSFSLYLPMYRRTGTCNNSKEARGRVSNYWFRYLFSIYPVGGLKVR